MKMRSIVYLFCLLALPLGRGDNDRFNYRSTVGNDYGPEGWSQVTCGMLGNCPGWPDGWTSAVGWKLENNLCQWCPETGNTCGLHSQSPINLLRSEATTGHNTECYDYHRMSYEDRSCRWLDIIDNNSTLQRNNFQIRRHALQILQPVDGNGNLHCHRDGKNAYPRLDYSKGFPNWWHLSHTSITVPSEHFQEGKQYDAEVHLEHFYEINYERKMGVVSIFLEADPNQPRWPFLDKLICQWREVEEKSREACGLSSVPAYPGCRNPTRNGGGGAPTESPVASPIAPLIPSPPPVTPSTAPPVVVPPSLSPVATPVICADYKNHPFIKMAKICNACCSEKRSSTNYCHSMYELFGGSMSTVCTDCCSPPKKVAPPPPLHPIYPPIQCSLVNNTFRMCKQNACCEPTRSRSSFCQGVYDTYGDIMPSVCWYCCEEPKKIDTKSKKVSRSKRKPRKLEVVASNETMDTETMTTMQEETRHDVLLQNGFYASELKMHPSNFEVNEDLEHEYLSEMELYRNLREDEEEIHRRGLQMVNYDDVRYSPYQWLREVKTEYYFRYEGGQMVPPCFETVHHRIMKDPIPIHPTQLAELERLLAWRISPLGSGFNECQNDTAGRPRAGSNGNAVDVNRPLQAYSNIHRKVFCECDDWESKFQEDIDWCAMSKKTRYYDEPYNFDSAGSF